MMVEGEAKECSEADLVKALEIAHEAIRIQVKAQEELRDLKGVKGKRDYTKPATDEALKEKVYAFAQPKVYEIAKGQLSKHERSDRFAAVHDELQEYIKSDLKLAEGEEVPSLTKKLTSAYYSDLQYDVVRDMILDERVRLDGRNLAPTGYGSGCIAFATWCVIVYKRRNTIPQYHYTGYTLR
ncbi:MAG TPA: hypothetical protein PLR98_14070 [Chitinophagaceae bacterium]|nr:hypothetical protein [Chitinophagaceae bacterium]